MKYIYFTLILAINNICFSQTKVYEEIQYCETIKSKFYISVLLPNRTTMKVPVINGFIPEIMNYNNQDSSIRRVFNYNRETPYLGGTPDYVPLTNDFLKCPQSKNKAYDSGVPVPSFEFEKVEKIQMKKGSSVKETLPLSPTYKN